MKEIKSLSRFKPIVVRGKRFEVNNLKNLASEVQRPENIIRHKFITYIS
jgi:hypothetical protein